MVITYPLLTVVDDSGVITSGATVTITSVTDKSGGAIGSPGATINQAGPNVSVDYDAEAKGESWVTLAISKAGSTFTNMNASPAYYLARDSSRTLSGFNATGQTALASAGLDSITVEAGVNARQALSPILAACAAVLSGAGTGTILIKAGNNPGTTRITATTDAAGNRTAITLNIPA